MNKNKKGEYKKLERIIKGFSNHRRIEIMFLLKNKPELSVMEIANELGVNFKTISGHITKLSIAGIVMKRSDSTSIRHKLTRRGEEILAFLKKLD